MIDVVELSGTTMVGPGSRNSPPELAAGPSSHRQVDGDPVGGVVVPELMPAELAAGISDEELSALALAAGDAEIVDDDAISLWDLDPPQAHGLLPGWYMPTAAAGTRRLRGWRRNVALMVVTAFLAIDAAGLCSTYGPIISGH